VFQELHGNVRANGKPMVQITRILRSALLLSILAQTVSAHPPTGIVTDKKGNVYFTDLEAVWKLDPSGRVSVFRAGISGRHVHELAIDADDTILGADLSYESQWISAIWKMSPQGALSYLLEPTNNPPRGMSMWLDRQGRMYVVDQDNRNKKHTLLLRRTPEGLVSTLAGSSYGYADGKGTDAKFSSVGGLAITSDNTVYLTDGTAVRKVTSDGLVTTVARDLNKRTAEDRPLLFGNNDGILAGLSVGKDGTIFVADAGNQRLLKIDPQGTVSVVYRGEEPYYPNGVIAASNGDLFALEVGFKPPSTWLQPRIRKIMPNGESRVVAVAAEQQPVNAATATVTPELSPSVPLKYFIAIGALGLVGAVLIAWKRTRLKRQSP
jgi:sugar lactone lactonase YvrE